MAFSRIFKSEDFYKEEELTQSLSGLGFLLSSKTIKNANIEHGLMSLLDEVFLNKSTIDLRLLALMVNWLEIHITQVNANRFVKLLVDHNNKDILNFISSVFEFIGDIRFNKFVQRYRHKKRTSLIKNSSFLIKKNGEDERFSKTNLIVHSKALPNRPELILSPKELSSKHIYYKYRVLLGPTYRSDVIANLSINPNLKVSDLARLHFTNYQTSYKAKKDFEVFSFSLKEAS